MRSNKKLLARANLYLILDAQVLDHKWLFVTSFKRFCTQLALI